uniref:Zinc finger protein 638 n=1 Tax=Falco tinnunculus TaxID=100819 RepID=A0A8C4V3U9_FALTI
MFSPRGTLPQRPRGPNPSGTKPPGSFRGGGAAGLQRKPAPGTPQGISQRFSGQETFQWTGSQRINVRVTLHRADPRKVKEKTNLHQEQKGEPRTSCWDNSPCSAGTTGQKPPASARIAEQNSNAQNRYTPESASSILASFGLSNEDLEELSRYPDDQLTPENMPLILREIRMRKMGHSLSGLHTQSRGEETIGGTSGGAAVKSKVIDYGHASKYGYTEDPLEVHAYNPEVLTEDPLEPAIPPHVMPPMTQPPFSAEILAAMSQHERIQHESGTSQSNAQSSSGAGQKPFQTQAEGPIKSPFGIVKASWLPVFPQSDAQKIKRLPTPSMMNDYYATSPRIFPHMCSLCNIECTHMKDWILHQNTPSHIESCRQLRQQNAGDRKENQTPKRRSNSASPSPRRSRVTGSSYVLRRSRSRSRSPGRFRPTRPRSRSPRQMRRLSPRHRSRSPQRSRNPLRTSPRPQRSSSNDWSSRRSTRSQDRKAALEAVVKSLGPGFVAEFNKHKSLQAAGQGSSGLGKSPPSHGLLGKMPGNMKKTLKTGVSPKASKTDVLSLPGSSSSSPETDDLSQGKEMEEDEEDLPTGTSGPRPTSSNRVILQISDLPDDGFSDQDIKKIVQPFGKVSDLIVLRSRNEAFLEMNYKEAVIAAVKYGETVPVLVNGKRVKISVAEKPKASPGQVSSLLVKNMTLHGVEEIPVTFTFACLQELDDTCVVLISNLPEKGYSVEEVSNLAKPFGGPRDVLILSSHKKAYLEINRKSADSMVKFYTCFPMSLDGNQLCINMVPQYKTIKDEEAIFTALIKDSDPQVNTETIHNQFVHLGNLPDDGYRELEVVCVGLRFGKVGHYVVLKNKNKAILQLDSPKSARSMYSFLKQYPYNMGEHTLTCTLSPNGEFVERKEPSLCKGGEQRAPLKPETQGQAAVEKNIASKEAGHPKPGNSRSSLGDGSGKCKVNRSSVVDGKGGNGRNSSQQEKDSREESRASSKQSQEGESRSSSMKKDNNLDYLLPKAGFFCQICSLFYADETSVKNHCKTLLHQQNMEKFMAKQKDEDNGGEERSSR